MTARPGELRFGDEIAERAFRTAGLDSLAALCACVDGEVVTTAATRSCRRIAVNGVGYYVKTQDLDRARLPRRKLVSYLLRGSPLLREVRALRELAAHGIATPPLVAWGHARRGLLPWHAALITRELPGHVDLATWCGSPAAADDAVARRTFDAAAACVAVAHAAGLVLAGARYRNLLVPRTGCGEPGDVVVLDQPNLRRSRSRRGRARDLAALAADRARFGSGR